MPACWSLVFQRILLYFQEGNITSYLNEGKVHVAINLTKGPIVIVHPQRIDDNMWHSIYYEFKW